MMEHVLRMGNRQRQYILQYSYSILTITFSRETTSTVPWSHVHQSILLKDIGTCSWSPDVPSLSKSFLISSVNKFMVVATKALVEHL